MPETVTAFTTDALIERWTAAFVWANGKPPCDPLTYERGWFVQRSQFCVRFRARKVDMIQRITRLENRPKA